MSCLLPLFKCQPDTFSIQLRTHHHLTTNRESIYFRPQCILSTTSPSPSTSTATTTMLDVGKLGLPSLEAHSNTVTADRQWTYLGAIGPPAENFFVITLVGGLYKSMIPSTKRASSFQPNREMEETLVKGIQKGWEILTNGRIDSRKLQPGDHIFVNRFLRTFTHHGIYVGDGYVIHFRERGNIFPIPQPPCWKCHYKKAENLGIVKTCLDCFLSEDIALTGHTPRLYQYGVSSIEYVIRKRGTCTTNDPSKQPQKVVKTATELLQTGFGRYDFIENNCEHFATFCKTGIRFCSQTEIYAFARELVQLL